MKHTLAFYNIENLFDTENDAFTNDDDFLPHSKKRWTDKRYHNKLRKIGSVIATIGHEEHDRPPALVGLAEVENQKVLSDLLEHSDLKDLHYDFVHFDSSDERGIDVALLYDARHFIVDSAQPLSVYLENEEGGRDYTRDILHVHGHLDTNALHIFVNHWSSRRDGPEASEYKRLAASDRLLHEIQDITSKDPSAQIIVMGDFNDNPNNTSVVNLEMQADLFNPFKHIWSPQDKGSLNHDFEWNLFDQILFSHNVLDDVNSNVEFVTADVFDERFVTRYKGRFKGQPFRTYAGKRYLGGYSDHFPVYITFKIDPENV